MQNSAIGGSGGARLVCNTASMAAVGREDMEVDEAGSSSSSTAVQAQTLRSGSKAKVRTGLHVALATRSRHSLANARPRSGR